MRQRSVWIGRVRYRGFRVNERTVEFRYPMKQCVMDLYGDVVSGGDAEATCDHDLDLGPKPVPDPAHPYVVTPSTPSTPRAHSSMLETSSGATASMRRR